MIRSGLPRMAAIIGAIGLALVAFETVQAMRSVAIDTLGTTLIFVGVGLFVVSAVLVVVSLTVDADDPSSPARDS